VRSAKEPANEARANNTPVVLVTVGILKATYGDRSAWRDKEALERNIFDDGRGKALIVLLKAADGFYDPLRSYCESTLRMMRSAH